VEGGLPDDEPKDWPSLEKVRRYTARLRSSLDDALRAADAKDSGLERLEHGRLLDVAIEHRLMHAETLCYMLHQLPVERKFGRSVLPPPTAQPSVPVKVAIPAGIATLACGARKTSFWLGQRIRGTWRGRPRLLHRCIQRDESGVSALRA